MSTCSFGRGWARSSSRRWRAVFHCRLIHPLEAAAEVERGLAASRACRNFGKRLGSLAQVGSSVLLRLRRGWGPPQLGKCAKTRLDATLSALAHVAIPLTPPKSHFGYRNEPKPCVRFHSSQLDVSPNLAFSAVVRKASFISTIFAFGASDRDGTLRYFPV
jgi:hypothetical protein